MSIDLAGFENWPAEPAVARPQKRETVPQAETAPSDRDLEDRFRPIFARIAEGAIGREQSRALPFEAVGWLRDAGFGAVRVPTSFGGLGASLPQFFRLLIGLAAADSNLSHLFRGHFSFIESLQRYPDPKIREVWLRRVADGALIGFAMSERIETTDNTVALVKEGAGWVLNGEKYYSTGSIFADWIVVSAFEDRELVSLAVPADAPGVARLDDWDGFGQRLTGSGTTRFERVSIGQSNILERFVPGKRREPSYYLAFLQMILLGTLAGIARASVRDAVAFVQGRTRAFGVPGLSSPKADPLVQRVIGRLSSLSYAIDAIIDTTAHRLEDLNRGKRAGTVTEDDYTAATIAAFQAQQIVIDLTLQTTTLLFEVGGASATSEARRLDRHWRNARTAASHNPAIFRERAIGDYLLNGTKPDSSWFDLLRRQAEEKEAAADPSE